MKSKKLYLLLVFVFILAVVPVLSGCASVGDTVGRIFSPVAVTMVSPQNESTNVNRNVVVKASFNEAMNGLSFNGNTFLLLGPGGRKVTGAVYYNDNSLTNYIASFTPAGPLKPNTEYTAELTTGIMGNLQQHLGKNYIWRFTTRE